MGAARVAADVKLAIATSGNEDKQFPVIRGAGLKLEWFDVVVTGDDVTNKKPDPQIYEITAEKLGLPPERCVVIEDAPAGVGAAKAAGMTCVAVTGSVSAESLQEADLVVDSIATVGLPRLRRMV
jgi:sugar-phosphatase